ncbi:G patch domain and ankyrin repeat-containing protein 1-like [Dendronephthya gigantea]|uniref:G patch domain and ankyrin repeat-containing protein 1-like n=1 Tax=Dendronephthya gigantea TaxID=151771 RepID=UPI00106C52EE|nr:G patch domain and ankyrin repeat-containing protein 1-like [Dendronephthya gigantea]
MKRKKGGLMYPSVKFQRASSNLETFSAVKKSDTSLNDNGGLSGVEAKEFYESLLMEKNETCVRNAKRVNKADIEVEKRFKRKTTDVNTPSENNKTKWNLTDRCTIRQVNSFLRMAQEGDLSGLQEIIRDKKVDINAKDQFGWTALMCSARSGHRTCIKLLLKEGADVKLQNSKGETARDIAKHSGVRRLFDRLRKSRRKQKSDNAELTTSTEHTCDICATTFFGSKNEHNTSTAHLFNCQYKSERTLYHIPETNIGFKLMKQKGWDKEQGLGPEGAGRKFPVKTILKQDRQGLGSKNKEKAKITHFSARDTSAVKGKKDAGASTGLRAPRRTWKRNLIQKQEKDKRWEQNLRVYMNTE